MRIHPRTLPGFEETPVQVHRVESFPGRRMLALSVDEEALQQGPIRRGEGPPFLERAAGGKRERITDPARQREHFLPVVGPGDSHLLRFEKRHPERIPVALCGCGNLGMNPGVLALLHGRRLGVPGCATGTFEVLPDGSGRLLPELPDRSHGFALSGPLLLKAGEPTPLGAKAFADPRHLLRFPYVEVRPGLKLDFGLDQLLAAGQEELYQRAVAGKPVTLPLQVRLPSSPKADGELLRLPVPIEALEQALAEKGYQARKDWSLHGGQGLTLRFRPGIYPHHVLLLTPDARLVSLLISGLSNRAGVVLCELQEDLAEAGFSHALLMDNGGDVGLYRPPEGDFALRPSEPDRARAWRLSACLVYYE